jgi:hypothetical protein
MARAGLRICDPRHIRRNSQISSQCSVIRQSVAEPRLRREGVSRASVFLQLTVLEAIMKEALQPTLVLVLWIVFWLAGTLGGAVLQAWLIDIGVLSEIDPPWIITIGSSFVGFFAGAYAAVKLGDLALKQK